ncbi:hypothetical protein QFC22_006042 [Naganishia vaughanmartiniae]|uniref:Uncharacterized protein n=1 Tax=Naganishia vaughanmartiniae TaxID=1424756 RepID=A0ACC2WP11_9TREE|nr:hypothetical protein QFC22_006042 [Naganishia vaughanmartiniae]
MLFKCISRSRLLLLLLFIAIHTIAITSVSADQAPGGPGPTISELKKEGDTFVRSGKFAEAGRSYSQALELDPQSFNLHYLLATTQLHQGKHSQALASFSKLLELKPEFIQAHFQRAKILAKDGSLESAKKEVQEFLKGLTAKEKQSGEDTKLAQDKIDAKALSDSLDSAIGHVKAARKALASKAYSRAAEEASKALLVAPNSVEIREIRMKAHEGAGDLEEMIGDLSRLVRLQPSVQSYGVLLAQLNYFILHDPQTASDYVRQCLRFDPEAKACKQLHRFIRQTEKEVTKAKKFADEERWRDVIKIVVGSGDDGLLAKFEAELAKVTPSLPAAFPPSTKSRLRLQLHSLACKAYVKLGNQKGMKQHCPLVASLSQIGGDQDEWALVGLGEIAMKAENWEEAVRHFRSAFEKGGRSSQNVLDRLQKAERTLKVSKQKDYYKVLGVARDADTKTIKKAFRKAAKANHPDVGGSEEKMAAINEAYKVLSDDELRARYDNGDDPNDPMGGQQGGPGGGGFHHGHHGGFPGGGGNFHQFFKQGGGGGQQQFFFHDGF